jgi:hypothetical protein
LHADAVAQKNSVAKTFRGAPPDSIDSRTSGVVAESNYALKDGSQNLNSLSEQNLVDCVTICDGGLEQDAYDWVLTKQNGYFNSEASHPDTCKSNASINKIVSSQHGQSGDENDLDSRRR